MINKLIGFGLIFISALLYLGHYIIMATYKHPLSRNIRDEPRTIAAIALISGIIYLARGEFRDYLDRKEQSRTLA